MPTNLSRTRFDVIRESELDMRCMARDMKKRREITEELERLRIRKQRGHEINEVMVVRLSAQKKKLSNLILGRWGRLHRRMNREASRRAEIEGMFGTKERTNGNAAHT
jgi:hypothetical protein